MTRQELSRQIAGELLINDCLNEADYPSIDTLLATVTDLISHRLEDYIIITGKIL